VRSPGRFRFADYALFERDPTPPDSWLAARSDGSLGLLRLELWHGLAAEAVIEAAGRWFLELHDVPVVPLVDAGASPDRGGFLVRRLPGGVTLDALSRRLAAEGGALPPSAALALGVALAELFEALVSEPRALPFAHPLTCGFAWDGRPWFDPPSLGALASQRGVIEGALWLVRGTPRPVVDLLTPEEVRGLVLDGRSAAYKLGALLHRLWTGRRVVEASSEVEALMRVREGELHLAELPGPLAAHAALLREMLARSPEERPASPALVARRLRESVRDDADGLSAFLQALFRQEHAREEELREEIALLSPEDVARWPVLRAAPPLPAVT
jgi:hypothetical protein